MPEKIADEFYAYLIYLKFSGCRRSFSLFKFNAGCCSAGHLILTIRRPKIDSILVFGDKAGTIAGGLKKTEGVAS